MKLRDAVLFWTHDGKDVLLVDRDTQLNYPHLYKKYNRCTLAPNFDWRDEMNDKQRMVILFAEAMALMVRDGVNPHDLHKELCKLEDYRYVMAEDMPYITD
jgi:hypothetical protein